MFLGEPQETQWDLRFSVLGFPVRVHPLFWLTTAIMGWNPHGGGMELQMLLLWMVVVFVSILVHELGHALAARSFGGYASIVLFQFGGLAIHHPQPRYTWQRVFISFAGPLAGFIFAVIVAAAVQLSGHEVTFVRSWVPIEWEQFDNDYLDNFIWQLLWVNVMWGVFNLMPIYPLDGGQIARTLLVHHNPWRGLRWSQALSIVVAVGLALLVWQSGRTFTVLMLAFLAFQNWQEMQSPWNSRNPW